jgi:hypothetical protein
MRFETGRHGGARLASLGLEKRGFASIICRRAVQSRHAEHALLADTFFGTFFGLRFIDSQPRSLPPTVAKLFFSLSPLPSRVRGRLLPPSTSMIKRRSRHTESTMEFPSGNSRRNFSEWNARPRSSCQRKSSASVGARRRSRARSWLRVTSRPPHPRPLSREGRGERGAKRK